ESFIFSGRTVHVKADRAAGCDFFMGKHSADYQSVAEQHPSAGLQYAKHLAQHPGPSRNMAQHVVREYGIKGVVIEGEFVRNIALLETGLRGETSCQRKLVRVANSGRINVQPYEAAAHFFRKVQPISPRTAP